MLARAFGACGSPDQLRTSLEEVLLVCKPQRWQPGALGKVAELPPGTVSSAWDVASITFSNYQ